MLTIRIIVLIRRNVNPTTAIRVIMTEPILVYFQNTFVQMEDVKINRTELINVFVQLEPFCKQQKE